MTGNNSNKPTIIKLIATKKEITLGIIGNDSCEIISGLNIGDEVIIEGTNSYRYLDQIEIQN